MGSIAFETHPSRYRHWRLEVRGPVATLGMHVAEDGGVVPGYELSFSA